MLRRCDPLRPLTLGWLRRRIEELFGGEKTSFPRRRSSAGVAEIKILAIARIRTFLSQDKDWAHGTRGRQCQVKALWPKTMEPARPHAVAIACCHWFAPPRL